MATVNKTMVWMGKQVTYDEYLSLWLASKKKMKQAKHMANVKSVNDGPVGITGTTITSKTTIKPEDWLNWSTTLYNSNKPMTAKKKVEPTPLTISVGTDPDPDTMEVPIPQPQMKPINQKKDLFDKLTSFQAHCISEKEEVPTLINEMILFLNNIMTSLSDDQYNQAWEAGYNAGMADAKHLLKAKDLHHPV